MGAEGACTISNKSTQLSSAFTKLEKEAKHTGLEVSVDKTQYFLSSKLIVFA